MWEYILRSLCACVLAVSLATCSCRAHMPVPLLQPFQQYLQHTYTHNIARTKMLYILSLASISPLLVAFATCVVKFYIPRETCFSVAMHVYVCMHIIMYICVSCIMATCSCVCCHHRMVLCYSRNCEISSAALIAESRGIKVHRCAPFRVEAAGGESS